MMPEKFDEEELHNMSADKVTDYLAECTLEGKWEKVICMYNQFPSCHTAVINESVGTALHVAVDLAKKSVVQELVEAVIRWQQQSAKRIKALEIGNECGDTPLHVAASRGVARICKWIIGANNERIYLVSRKNKHGETPLFQAANWHREAFAYLSHISGNSAPLQDLVRDNGDTILHCAITRGYYDLAVIIVHYYDFLSTHTNDEGFTPLKVLATKPSAFKSTTKLSWWRRILYHCIVVEPLDPERQMKANLAKMEEHPDKVPKNYATLYDFFAGSLSVAAQIGKMLWKKNHDTENPPINKQCTIGFLPPNYETFQQFLRSAYVHILGVSGVRLKEVKKKHQWSGQLLKALMNRPYAAFMGSGGVPNNKEVEKDIYSVYSEWKQGETSNLELEEETIPKPSNLELEEEKKPKADDKRTSSRSALWKETAQLANERNMDKKETAFLVAARNGIVEMVNEILSEIPSAIHNTNSWEENVLLVAVRNRKPLIVESLIMKLHSEPEVWTALTLAVDHVGETVLHLAAYAPEDDKPWQISGSALQMMWDVNWFQYIKRIVPRHFGYIRGEKGKTPWEVFKETHVALRRESSDWLKETSESCSVVAALVAGVSFATANAIPGGADDKGLPHLEGKPAFHAFVIASLIGLCFSVTGLIMFLTILTSRKLHRDFGRSLPLKLLLGLSSLFLAIVAMLVSFCTGHSFLLSQKYKKVIFPFYVATCFPVTFYAASQLPLYFDLLATIFVMVPLATDEGDSL